MKNFEYVTRNEYMPVKKELIDFINAVQDEIREYLTFSYDFIGSSARNMITREVNGNVGYDFDINLKIRSQGDDYSPSELRKIIRLAFDKHKNSFGYDFSEDNTRVITLKVKDKKNKRILHSCDFAIVRELDNGREQYIRYNKKQQSYYWDYQPKGYYHLNERIEDIKKYNHWDDVKELYLEKKNANEDDNKKSRSLFAETINEIYERHFYLD